MISSRITALRTVVRTLDISLGTLVDTARGRLTVERSDARLARWSRDLLTYAAVKLRTEGFEGVPRARAFVLMSNHESHYDIPIMYQAFQPRTLRMVAKAELFRIPVWGRAMREAGFIPVDRSGDKARAKAAMAEAARAVAAGVNIWIAPEGTRSLGHDGELGAFKKGGFLLARDTNTPIIPVGIDGSRDILEKHSLDVQRGVVVTVRFGSPIDPNGELESVMATAYQEIDRLRGKRL